jgi:hypothetical protein
MNIILPGVMRCGTTSLRHYLSRHPALRPPKRREIEYFSTHYDKGPAWYQLQLSQGGIDKSPNYLASIEAPRRIARDLPNAKFIILLRDPVARAWSHYRWLRQIKHVRVSFRETLSDASTGWHSVIRRGYYAEQLSHWLQFISPEQIHIVKSERFWSSPQKVYSEIVRFLGLRAFTPKGFRKHGTVREIGEMSKPERGFLTKCYTPHNNDLYELLGRDMEW